MISPGYTILRICIFLTILTASIFAYPEDDKTFNLKIGFDLTRGENGAPALKIRDFEDDSMEFSPRAHENDSGEKKHEVSNKNNEEVQKKHSHKKHSPEEEEPKKHPKNVLRKNSEASASEEEKPKHKDTKPADNSDESKSKSKGEAKPAKEGGGGGGKGSDEGSESAVKKTGSLRDLLGMLGIGLEDSKEKKKNQARIREETTITTTCKGEQKKKDGEYEEYEGSGESEPEAKRSTRGLLAGDNEGEVRRRKRSPEEYRRYKKETEKLMKVYYENMKRKHKKAKQMMPFKKHLRVTSYKPY